MVDPSKIFNFPTGMAYDPKQAGNALVDHPEIYMNHISIASHLERWGNRVGRYGAPKEFVDALLDIAAHLRQGDYVPGSSEYESEIRGRF